MSYPLKDPWNPKISDPPYTLPLRIFEHQLYYFKILNFKLKNEFQFKIILQKKLKNFKLDKFNLAHSAQLAQSSQFYFLIINFNQKSKSVKMCKKNFNTFLHLQI